MAWDPRKSAEFIAKNSAHVKIHEAGVKRLVAEISKEIKSGALSASSFMQCGVHPKPTDPWALDWILVADTLNFCFWHFEGQKGWTVKGQTGYFALCAALNRSLKAHPHFLDPKYYATITEEELGKILKGDSDLPIPLLSERVKCLQEVGTVLTRKFDGSFKKFVEQADNSAEKLLEMIVNNFECFRDEATFKGQKVSFYKRAQILIGDIWSCFKGGIGHFKDIDKITIFADYRLPQSLIFFGALEYNEELNKKLQQDIVLKNGEEDEVEIRGCTVHAAELICQELKKSHDDVNSIIIDHFLWDFRRRNAKEMWKLKIPFHKTCSVYY